MWVSVLFRGLLGFPQTMLRSQGQDESQRLSGVSIGQVLGGVEYLDNIDDALDLTLDQRERLLTLREKLFEAQRLYMNSLPEGADRSALRRAWLAQHEPRIER